MQKGKNSKTSPKSKPNARPLKDEEVQSASGGIGKIDAKYENLLGARRK